MDGSTSCDRCGAPDPELQFSIGYSEYPPGRWARRKDLLDNQLGTLRVALCNRCRWAHFRSEQILEIALVLGFLAVLAYLDPGARELGWWLAFVALVPIGLIAAMPLLPRGLKELEAALFREHEQRLAVAHGITTGRLRPIRSHW